jgi:hypothetical protein
MEIDYVMAVDPGQATGVAIARYSATMPMEVLFTEIVSGGAHGFAVWLHHTRDGKTIVENDCSYNFPEEYDELDYHFGVVCENFKLRGGNFAPDLEPLRIEGILMDHFGTNIEWHSPADKSLIGDAFLKENDLWLTGRDVGHEDARDANDAIIHLFVHAMRIRHLPTLELYWRNNVKSN